MKSESGRPTEQAIDPAAMPILRMALPCFEFRFRGAALSPGEIIRRKSDNSEGEPKLVSILPHAVKAPRVTAIPRQNTESGKECDKAAPIINRNCERKPEEIGEEGERKEKIKIRE